MKPLFNINWPAFKRSIKGKGIKGIKAGENNYIENPTDLTYDNSSDFCAKISRQNLVFTIIVLFLSLFLQEALFNSLRILGAKPQIVLCTIMVIASLCDSRSSLFIGLASGLLLDIGYGRFFGFYALLFMYFGIITSVVISKSLKGKAFFFYTITPFLLILFLIIQGFLSRIMVLYVSEANIVYYDFITYLFRVFLPELVYNYFIVSLLYLPIRSFFMNSNKKKHRLETVFKGGNE